MRRGRPMGRDRCHARTHRVRFGDRRHARPVRRRARDARQPRSRYHPPPGADWALVLLGGRCSVLDARTCGPPCTSGCCRATEPGDRAAARRGRRRPPTETRRPRDCGCSEVVTLARSASRRSQRLPRGLPQSRLWSGRSRSDLANTLRLDLPGPRIDEAGPPGPAKGTVSAFSRSSATPRRAPEPGAARGSDSDGQITAVGTQHERCRPSSYTRAPVSLVTPPKAD